MKRLDEPCKCGWKYAGFHLCVDLADPATTRVHPVKEKRVMSDEHRARISQAQVVRHRALSETKKKRDDAIIALYPTMGMQQIAVHLGHAQSTVNKVLNRAAADGRIAIRPKGTTLARPGV